MKRPRSYHQGLLRLPLLLWALLACPTWAQAEDPAEVDQNPLALTIQRVHADAYVGGEEITVQVTISGSSDEALFALGLYETVPGGWIFDGVQVDVGPQPDILPPEGASGVLEFGWVTPEVPVSLRYVLRIPPADSGARHFSGQAEYRLESDPKRVSAPVISSLEGVANEIPVLTLRGEATLQWAKNTPFIDPGATAQDKEDGDISDKIQSFGPVNVNQPGDYTITYGVIDSAGNRAEPLSRTVTVQASDSTGSPGGGTGGSPTGSDSPAAGMAKPLSRVPSTGQNGARQRGGDASELVVPEISLGGNKPVHQLPEGPAKGSASAAAHAETKEPAIESDGNLVEDPTLAEQRSLGRGDENTTGDQTAMTPVALGGTVARMTLLLAGCTCVAVLFGARRRLLRLPRRRQNRP